MQVLVVCIVSLIVVVDEFYSEFCDIHFICTKDR